MIIAEIRFTPFHGTVFPPGHSSAGMLVPPGIDWYAVPGGGVAMEAVIRSWGDLHGVLVVLL